MNKAIDYLKKSASQHHSHAQYLLGKIYFEGNSNLRDIDKSIYYLTLSANQYNSDAQLLLGNIYYFGAYIQTNIKESIHYYKISSSFNNCQTKNNLGIIYKNGEGVEKNINNAIIYFEEAIKQKNYTYSLYNFTRIYYFGIDIDQNIPKSIKLLEIAAKNHFEPASSFLYFIYSSGDNEVLNSEKAAYYLKIIDPNNHIFNQIKVLISLFCKKMDPQYKSYIESVFISRAFNFFKEYDLYSEKYPIFIINFQLYLTSGSQEMLKNDLYFHLNVKDVNRFFCKDINQQFYNGFYND